MRMSYCRSAMLVCHESQVNEVQTNVDGSESQHVILVRREDGTRQQGKDCVV